MTHANLPRFKRVELCIRDAANRCRDALAEIDAALAARARTEADRALLNEVRAGVTDVHTRAKAVLGKLFEVAE
jgi:hypothetical protein